MTEAIIVALITGGLSLAGIIVSSMASTRRLDSNIRTSQAVTDTKLEELTRRSGKHNNFAAGCRS